MISNLFGFSFSALYFSKNSSNISSVKTVGSAVVAESHHLSTKSTFHYGDNYSWNAMLGAGEQLCADWRVSGYRIGTHAHPGAS